MRTRRFILTASIFLVSAMPISELYAACTYTAVSGGGEIRECDNGTCWSRSLWQGNTLIAVLGSGCRETMT